MLILGLETSCDETAAAILEDGTRIISNVVSSQVDIHKKFRGVVPELAARSHLRLINAVLQEATNLAGVSLNELDAVAVTYGPGLVGSLLIGLSFAKALSFTLRIPLIGVNHLEGHIYASFLEYPELTPPLLALIASGGHSELILMQDHGKFKVIGRTRDDAAGEAFDKVAKLLELGYPGGPIIDALARKGDREAVKFPIARMKDSGAFDFSFSGLKTAVINYLRETPAPVSTPDLAASFQQAVCCALISKTIEAARENRIETVVLGGGVAANTALREGLREKAQREGMKVHYPSPEFCTDNAAMIATAGYFNYKLGKRSSLTLDAVADLTVESKE